MTAMTPDPRAEEDVREIVHGCTIHSAECSRISTLMKPCDTCQRVAAALRAARVEALLGFAAWIGVRSELLALDLVEMVDFYLSGNEQAAMGKYAQALERITAARADGFRAGAEAMRRADRKWLWTHEHVVHNPDASIDSAGTAWKRLYSKELAIDLNDQPLFPLPEGW